VKRVATIGSLIAAGCLLVSVPELVLMATRAQEPAGSGAGRALVPWVECNTAAHVENTVAGLLVWRRTVDTAIVSTTPGGAELLKRVRDAAPGIRLVPGLKTFRLLPDFDDADGWRRVGEEVKAIRSDLGGDAFLFEHEHAVRGLWGDDGFEPQTLDLDAFRAALVAADLPAGVTYYWYPSVPSRSGQVQALARTLCVIVADVLGDVVWIDNASVNGPLAAAYEPSVRAGQMIRGLGRSAGLLYFYGPGSAWWDDVELMAALERGHEGYGTLLIYTGQTRFAEAARSLSDVWARNGR